MDHPAETARQVRRWGVALLPVPLFALALVALHELAGELRLHDILAAFRAIEPWRVTASVVLAAASYLVLTGHERLALAFVGRQLPWRRYALTAFVSYAIGNNLSLPAISGVAVRYRFYATLGLGAGGVATIMTFCTVSFLLGVALLTGASLVAHAGEAATLLHASRTVSRIVGCGLLALVVAYFAAARGWRRPVRWRGWQLPMPSARIAAAQLVLASADLVFASACAYVLLPASAHMPFVAFAALYMVALGVSLVTAVPGGVGVFESVLVLMLPQVPPAHVLGALLAYRLVYFVLPFLVALAVLTTREVYGRNERKRSSTRSPGAASPSSTVA
jgi:phosphatidylglycerol lysyltransferase